jgi:hypothetical protein
VTLRYRALSAQALAAVRAEPDLGEAVLVEFALALAAATPKALREQLGERRYEFANGAVVARLELDEEGDVVAVEIVELEVGRAS